MKLTRKQVIDNLSSIMDSMPDDVCGEWRDSLAYAIDTMRKYQKIEDIYYHQTGRAIEDSLRAVIEDGNDDSQ